MGMARFVRMDANVDGELFDQDPVSWPAEYFHDDPRMRRTHEFWQDWVGALSAKELREMRDLHSLRGKDWGLDQLLDSEWDGYVLVHCGEWES